MDITEYLEMKEYIEKSDELYINTYKKRLFIKEKNTTYKGDVLHFWDYAKHKNIEIPFLSYQQFSYLNIFLTKSIYDYNSKEDTNIECLYLLKNKNKNKKIENKKLDSFVNNLKKELNKSKSVKICSIEEYSNLKKGRTMSICIKDDYFDRNTAKHRTFYFLLSMDANELVSAIKDDIRFDSIKRNLNCLEFVLVNIY